MRLETKLATLKSLDVIGKNEKPLDGFLQWKSKTYIIETGFGEGQEQKHKKQFEVTYFTTPNMREDPQDLVMY